MEKKDLTFEEMKLLSEEEQDKLFNEINIKRNLAKLINFSSLYNAGPPTIAKAGNITLEEAKKLYKVYWERNKGVKLATDDFKVKKLNIDNKTETYIFNPISKMWLYLRNEKDKFSVVNQSSAVYSFNVLLSCCLKRGLKLNFQIHDKKSCCV